MRTIRTKVFKFNELTEDAKQKAIEYMNDINVDEGWHEPVTDEEESKLYELGFNYPKIMFSGFASQGDGACFTCSSIDFYKFMNGKYRDYAMELSCSITHSYKHYFSTSTMVNLDIDMDGIGDEKLQAIERDVENEREKIGNEIYKRLEAEYEYLTSNEAVSDTLKEIEYEFTADGRRFLKTKT